MGKKGGSVKRSGKSVKPHKGINEDQYDDEIDAFHKQRDIIPLDVNEDIDESDDDDVEPVFDLKGVDDEEDDDEDKEDDEEEEKEDENGLTAKMIKQNKYLRAKFGDADEEMAEGDKEKDEQEKRITWGGKRSQYYDGDNKDIEFLSSDDEDLKEEEQEVLRLRAEQAANITAADIGLDDDSEDDSDRELTMEEMSVKGKTKKTIKDDNETHVEEIKKDINSLSKEEQMDVVYSSAPEVIGLLSELNDAVEELETKRNPVMSKLKEGGITLNGGTKYLEVKQLLLLAYCQSITFYLLLKSEGQPIRDHPVLTRLVDIKALLDKIKELDGNLPSGFEESLARCIADGTVQKVAKEDDLSSAVPASVAKITQDTVKPMKIEKSREDKKKKGEKRKHQSDQVDMQSNEMLKLRAALEGKLRSNGGVIASTVSKSDKTQKRQKLANRKLETFDDYVDDADNSKHNVTADKLTQLVIKRKPKTVSGDDDLPVRDDIGERRRKYELRILGEAGVKPDEDGKNGNEAPASDDDNDEDDVNDMVDNDGESEGSEDEFYKQVKQQQEAKRAAKAEIYSRKPYLNQSLPEEPVDGKRLISNDIKSNRGLTRFRNKDLKNPRKKYRIKHEEKVKRRKGQVRDMRTYTGSYGGESTGINPNISRSIRIKN